MKTNNALYKYIKNNTSQYGEDGIIEEVLKRLRIEKGNVLDIGAADGKWFSNSFTLLQNGFTVYGIEISTDRYNKMVELSKEYPNLIPIKAAVALEKNSKNHINNILKEYNIPTELEFATIDIDSIDAWVFEDMNVFPKLVSIEIEPSIYPLDMHWHDIKGNRQTNPPQNQTGFYPIYQIAKKKGYHFIAQTNCNVFFLRNNLIEQFASPEVTGVDELSNFNPQYLSAENKKKWTEYNHA